MLTHEERAIIRGTIGAEKTAQRLFRPRIDESDIAGIAGMVVERLQRQPASVTLTSSMVGLPDDRRRAWTEQCWINTITECARKDAAFLAVHQNHGSYAPRTIEAASPYIQAIDDNFVFFIWLVGWGGAEGDATDSFSLRAIFLQSAVLLENVQATSQGVPGGWGLLNSAVGVTAEFAKTAGIPVRTIATNDRVEDAFRRRGFMTEAQGLSFDHTTRAKPLALLPV